MRIILLIVSGLILVSSCGSKQNGKDLKKEIHDQTLEQHESTFEQKSSQMVYRVPTPIEFFRFYKDAGGKYNTSLLISANDASKYLSTREKAIAFGLYASDLAFSAVFGNNQQTISLFETSKTIANDLGLTEGYGEKIIKRFKSNLDNVDSLLHLTADSYWKIFALLEDQDQTEILSYITVAGWIESLYLAINTTDKNANENIKRCIADQQYVIENLSSYLKTVHESTAANDKVFNTIFSLNNTYNKLYGNPENISITDEQFEELKSLINKHRRFLVK